jgi:hypothetical protein
LEKIELNAIFQITIRMFSLMHIVFNGLNMNFLDASLDNWLSLLRGKYPSFAHGYEYYLK